MSHDGPSHDSSNEPASGGGESQPEDEPTSAPQSPTDPDGEGFEAPSRRYVGLFGLVGALVGLAIGLPQGRAAMAMAIGLAIGIVIGMALNAYAAR